MKESLKNTYLRDFSKSSIIVDRRELKKGEGFAVHWHNYFELEIILSGKGKHVYNGRVYEIKRGTVYLSSYYDFHSIEAITDLDIINISFGENTLEHNITEYISTVNSRFHFNFNDNDFKLINDLCDIIIKETNTESVIFSECFSQSVLNEIVIILIRKCHLIPERSPKLIQKAVAYTYKNFKNDISLEEVSEKLNVSVNYLGALFKKSIGISYNNFINKIRLKYACVLLSSSNMPIKIIALDSGYNSIEYFFYCFKKNLYVTPSEYRKQNSNIDLI